MILIVPASSISFLFLFQTSLQLEKQTLTALHDSNVSYMDRLDENLQLLYHIDYQLMSNYEWIQFGERTSSMEDYERFDLINSLRDQLTLIKTIHPLLESVHIYFPELATIYHSAPYAYGSFTVLDEEQNRHYQELALMEEQLQYYTDPVSGAQVLSLLMVSPNSAIDYYIILTISTNLLSQTIADNSSYDSDFYYFTMAGSPALTEGSAIGGDFTLSNMEPAMEEEAAVFIRKLRAENHQQNESVPYQKVRIDGHDFYAFYYALTYSGAYYIRLLPASFLFHVILPHYIMILAFCLTILLACVLFLLGIYRMVHKPLTRLALSFTQVEQGDFTVQAQMPQDSDFNYVFQGFNHMVKQLNTLIEENYTQTVLLQKAELKQLQAQINPHFLYNSFFMLQNMIRWDSEQAEKIASALARYFQYITRNSNELVPLEAEYSHSKDYVYIQELRFSGRIHIEAEALPEQYVRLPVPKLILQPVLENVFKHGLKNKEEKGLVRLSFRQDGDALTITIADNGDGLDEDSLNRLAERLAQSRDPRFKGEMTGILNIQKRLILFSHSRSPLRVFRSELGGLGVEITLTIPSEIGE